MANLITVLRFPVLVLCTVLLYLPGATPKIIAVPLIIVLIAMDTLDGIVARVRHETSLLGSVLDIMADRSVEIALWICFAHLHLVPVVIPLVFAVRGVIVDSLRSFSVGNGKTPFQGMRSRVGRWLVGSSFMRSTYGASKMIAFAGLATTHALAALAVQGNIPAVWASTSHFIFSIVSWFALGMCLVRGAPVVIEAFSSLAILPPTTKQG
ncbi:MAG: CDP-alcohol phosphatidyltransferase family protein [Anaerolineae bacterium]